MWINSQLKISFEVDFYAFPEAAKSTCTGKQSTLRGKKRPKGKNIMFFQIDPFPQMVQTWEIFRNIRFQDFRTTKKENSILIFILTHGIPGGMGNVKIEWHITPFRIGRQIDRAKLVSEEDFSGWLDPYTNKWKLMLAQNAKTTTTTAGSTKTEGKHFYRQLGC